jgi:hypothetical protein
MLFRLGYADIVVYSRFMFNVVEFDVELTLIVLVF